jgi:hypothetical protein
LQSGVSRAETNRAIRQDGLRETLAAKGLIQHVLENCNKIEDLENQLETADIQRLKIASELKLKLINKYLPDVREVAIEATVNGEISHRLIQIEYIDADSEHIQTTE